MDNLPAEIRQQILKDLFPSQITIKIRVPNYRSRCPGHQCRDDAWKDGQCGTLISVPHQDDLRFSMSLMLVSRVFEEDCADFLYSTNIFVVDNIRAFAGFKQTIGPVNASRIKRLVLDTGFNCVRGIRSQEVQRYLTSPEHVLCHFTGLKYFRMLGVGKGIKRKGALVPQKWNKNHHSILSHMTAAGSNLSTGRVYCSKERYVTTIYVLNHDYDYGLLDPMEIEINPHFVPASDRRRWRTEARAQTRAKLKRVAKHAAAAAIAAGHAA